MTTIRYVGPEADGVVIPLPHGGGVFFPRSEVVEVAAEIAKSLLEQDTFERVAAKKAPKNPKVHEPAPVEEGPAALPDPADAEDVTAP